MPLFLICYYDKIHLPVRGFRGGEVEVFVELFVRWDEFELVDIEVC